MPKSHRRGTKPGMKGCGIAAGRFVLQTALVVLAAFTASATTLLPTGGDTNAAPQAPCPTDQVLCSGSCVDPRTDNTHCAVAADCQGTSAGTACKTGEVCTAGICGSNCPAANPDDDKPDTKAIQECLDNPALSTVALARKRTAGSPGLIIDNAYDRTDAALHLPKGTTLTSVGSGACWTKETDGRYLSHDLNCAVLVAKNNLSVNMVASIGDGSAINRIIFDGKGAIRRSASPALCTQGARKPGTLRMPRVNRWVVKDSVLRDAMCGTALGVDGSDYLITNNLIIDSGDVPAQCGDGRCDRATESCINCGKDCGPCAAGKIQPWADGITVLRCARGSITDNAIIDATDVGIAHGGTGSTAPADGCLVARNSIGQVSKHVFSAIGVAHFPRGKGLHYGSEFRDNVVTGAGMMDFGIRGGKHPWDKTLCAKGGTISGNRILGAFINLNVDGWQDGVVANNTLGDPAGRKIVLGSFGKTCNSSTLTLDQRKFTLGDALRVDYSRQREAPTALILHGGVCTFNPSTSACSSER
jgi:hypothetical protein